MKNTETLLKMPETTFRLPPKSARRPTAAQSSADMNVARTLLGSV